MNWTAGSAAQVRSAIARAWLGARGVATLGTIALRPHQRAAAARLRTMLDTDRGALLADPVGLGKTYTALAAARDARRLLVVAPAALRSMWTDVLAASGVPGRIVSYQALSRGGAPPVDPDIVIADESHHVRNPATRRYAALARLSARARLLLLSATPVHNRPDDLRAQLALFLGRRAWAMREPELGRHIVKRESMGDHGEPGAPALPRVAGVRWLDVGDDDGVLRDIVHLPPPVPPGDGGDGGALIALSLVRQWGSSRAALDTALRRRLAQAESLLHALGSDRYPTRGQLRAWCFADGALQLAFPELAADAVSTDAAALIDQSNLHVQAVRALRERLARGPDPDEARAAALLRIRRRHAAARIVVFAEFAATVRMLYARLARCGGVAMLTHRGGQVAGGRVSRRELLTQFAPDAGAAVAPAQRVTMLIATDLLSEGVNLQQANVVVHADLPWSPARFEQRVGRVRRLSSPHESVYVYALRPPASADRLLRLERRLRRKIAAAARAVGVRGTILPQLFPAPPVDAPPGVRDDAAVTSGLERWLRDAPGARTDDGRVVVAAVRARTAGFLASVRDRGRDRIVAADGTSIDDAPAIVRAAVESAVGAELPPDPACVDAALARLLDWTDACASLEPLDLSVTGPAVARRRLIRRIEAIASRSPRHLRGRYLPLAREARRAASLTVGAGAEQVLAALADAHLPDEAWLNAVRTFARLHARPASSGAPAVRALLLLVPTASAGAAPRP